MARRIKADVVELFHEHNINTATRTLYLGSINKHHSEFEDGVDFALAESTIKNLHILESSDPEGLSPITVIINSPGGSVVEGLAIYDAIKACKNHVTAIGYGKIWSMAGYIMQAADTRVMMPNSSYMLHEGETGFESNHPRIIRQWFKHDEQLGKKLFDIYFNAFKAKNPDFKAKELEKMLLFDTILSAEKALEYGLIDEIRT